MCGEQLHKISIQTNLDDNKINVGDDVGKRSDFNKE